MGKEHTIGFEIRTRANMIRREANSRPAMQDAGNLTGMHGWVIGYLYERREEEVFQRDLEIEFNIRRSTVTGILQLMERNGLILRLPVPQDARLKRLVLTEKAISLHEKVILEIHEVESKLRHGLSEEELSAFFRTIDRIKANLRDQPNDASTI